jgi:regulator of RNase E activity RraB
MISEFPNDSDGDALRRVVHDGSDMSKPMYIDFQLAMPDATSSEAVAKLARELGYHVDVYDSPECSLPITCQCSTRMIATYDGVMAIQAELNELSKPFGGFIDGWGTFGNGPNGQPPAK